jgi:hypothetical protein
MCNIFIQREFAVFPLLRQVSAMHHERGITGATKEGQIQFGIKMGISGGGSDFWWP